ncbi:carboxypeptidase cpdS [Arthroderma uncinatum]|uniref:carboxypeptidase cpdS n=1 Tax=Arthroderma uncinatum TaxID=74035 RepID=UPI00144A9878|nr:carboxypeptidase cpdS [Arthroderma uncinatum]KAF3482053.1 carboxypeptidase cpdS [Arthroderma uncinatum]
MHGFSFLVLALSAIDAAVAGSIPSRRSLQHVGKRDPLPAARNVPTFDFSESTTHTVNKRQSSRLNSKTNKYAVDGTKIPEVQFDIGESYAGLMPISTKHDESRKLYFWYFPSENPAAEDEITIWLNGGPGCSSLEGLLQENGPFSWQYGTLYPVANPWAWNNLTNMVWVEQPVGTGFSQGKPSVRSQEDVATQFLGFFRNFVDTFDLHGKKIYIVGESYAGLYVPYIAHAMFAKKNKRYFNVENTLIFDPSINTDAVLEQVPAVPFVDHWGGLFPFNETFSKHIHDTADKCGYTSFMKDNLVYPPKGKLPSLPAVTPECDVWTQIFNAVSLVNPCFDVYQVATTCPLLYDVLGYPGSFEYLPAGANVYFNRTDVQKAINAPIQKWTECSEHPVFVDGKDNSEPSSFTIIPDIIEKSPRTIIAHGDLDYVLISNGTLLSIQNMTWGGAQGFTQEPSKPLFVPYHERGSLSTLAGAGVMGRHHTERKLTYVELYLTGHMGPQYNPAASFRILEFLLGRIDDLSK